jgi:ABC-type dipeptide/oligopeptide/nickel transport system permease component
MTRPPAAAASPGRPGPARWLGRRVGALGLLLLGVAGLVFLLADAPTGTAPGAAVARPGPPPGREETPGGPPRRGHGIEGPFAFRLLAWSGAVLRGDLGRSWREPQPVAALIAPRAGPTLRLVGGAALVALGLGLATGTLAARRRGGLTDLGLRGAALLGRSTSVVWVGLMLILVFAVGLGWLPPAGTGTGWHLLLPVLTLAARPAAAVARAARAAVVDGLAAGPGRAARAVRPALGAAAATLAASFTDLIAAAPLVETVFGRPGLGRLLVGAAGQGDVPVALGALLGLAVAAVLAATGAGLVHGLVDPHARA